MSEPTSPNPNGLNEFAAGERPMFHPPAPQKSGISGAVWVIAGFVLAIVIGLLILAGQQGKSGGSAAYAVNMAISNILMSEADIPAGGKETYIDGTMQNNGGKIVVGVTVTVTFANDAGQSPQVETQAAQVIRAREPYIDTVPVASAPLQPGQSRDFRVTFEKVTPYWNQITPVVKVVSVETK
jgi:hypothetical protein